jgi:hypothetical protein
MGVEHCVLVMIHRSVSQIIYHRMVGWLVNNELERIWKELVMA